MRHHSMSAWLTLPAILIQLSSTIISVPQSGSPWKRDPLLGEYFYVVGCKIHTPKISLTVYQVSGWEEALAKPEEHGWAAPYTSA